MVPGSCTSGTKDTITSLQLRPLNTLPFDVWILLNRRKLQTFCELELLPMLSPAFFVEMAMGPQLLFAMYTISGCSYEWKVSPVKHPSMP